MDVDDLLVIADELRISDADQRRHVENIHIAITTLIIASFVTPAVQNTIQELRIEWHTNTLFLVTVVYLAFRLVDITIPIRRFSRNFDWIFGFIAPLGFLFSVLTYLVFFGFALFDIQISTSNATGIVIGVVIVSLSLSILDYWSAEENTDSSVSRLATERMARDFELFIFDNPEIVESGLSWETHQVRRGQSIVDMVGRDKDGRIAYGELKLGDIDSQRAFRIVKLYSSLFEEGKPDEERFLLITNGEVNQSARKILENYSIEIKTIDYEINR